MSYIRVVCKAIYVVIAYHFRCKVKVNTSLSFIIIIFLLAGCCIKIVSLGLVLSFLDSSSSYCEYWPYLSFLFFCSSFCMSLFDIFPNAFISTSLFYVILFPGRLQLLLSYDTFPSLVLLDLLGLKVSHEH